MANTPPAVSNRKIISRPKSESLSKEIEKVIPGGVNSPFRSFREVGGHTIFIDRGSGSKVTDVDGNTYIDYVGAWGPAVLGHAPQSILKRCLETLSKGPLFGTPHELELELARKIIDTVDSIEKIRFVNSGTEAVMSTIRLARGFTGRDVIVMLDGCYHGHSDSTLATTDHASSSGIPKELSQKTVTATFNDLDSLDAVMERNEGEVAAVIIEPVAGSMGVVPPDEGYLAGVRDLTTKYGALLIFDEVLTGFRVAYGGAQAYYGVTPDLTCYGKALGGGMPIGAYGGRADIMDALQPIGKVYQAGTFSGNPLTMSGGVATLEALLANDVFSSLEAKTDKLFTGLQGVLEKLGAELGYSIPVQLPRVGSMFAILFTDRIVRNKEDSESINESRFAEFFHEMLNRGIMLPPTAVDAACLSAAHDDDDIQKTIVAFEESLRIVMPKNRN